MKKLTRIVIGLMFIAGSAASVFAQSGSGKIVEQVMKMEAEYNEFSKKPERGGGFRPYLRRGFYGNGAASAANPNKVGSSGAI